MKHSGGKCVLTGEYLPDVLVAAHIWPVEEMGTDHYSNGLPLRSDIHILYDTGDIRIQRHGEVKLSNRLVKHPIYGSLPSIVALPTHTNLDAIDRRNKYL
jgi:hypothetical protein